MCTPWGDTVHIDMIFKSLPHTRTRSTSSSAVNGRPLDFCLHRHPVSVNSLYHAQMVLSVGGSFAYFMFTVRCIAILYYNNPTKCSCAQSILFHCSVTLHVSGAFQTHHQEYINCIYSLQYRSYIGAATFLQRDRV